MNERDKRKQEMLDELAKRFADSAQTMKNVAARIQSAANKSQQQHRRLEKFSSSLRNAIDSDQGPLPFSYLEFIEFSNGEEFAKYKDMPAICEEDLKDIDIDDLCNRLLESTPSAEESTD